jgi:hypothetical protein
MRVRRSRPIRGAVALVGVVMFTLSGAAPALAVDFPEYLSSFGPDGTETSDFEGIGSVAVDQQTDAVYVLDASAGSLYKFNAQGQPVDFGGAAAYISGNRINGLSPGTGPNESQVAVDPTSHVVYVTELHSLKAFYEDGEPALFTAGPDAGTNEISGYSELIGVAADVDGAIYASDFAGTVSIYSPSGEPITSIATPEPANLALASGGAVYVTAWTDGTLRKFTPDQFPVTSTTVYTGSPPKSPSTFQPKAGIAIDPVTADLYLLETNLNVSRIGAYDESGAFVRFFGAPGEPGELAGSAQGIAVIGGGEKLYAGNNDTTGPGAGMSKVEIFGFYEGKPIVESISATGVSADGSTLRARINPGSAETTYRFEYGLEDCSASTCTSVPASGASIGDGHQGLSVSQDIAGLHANTTYHYRVFAENEYGDNLAKETDHTFTTQSAGLGFRLSDSRAWEMVSPSDKHGALLVGSRTDHIQAAANGDGLIYASRGSIEPDPEGSRATEGSTVLAHRTAGGWRSKDIALANDHATPLPIGSQNPYKLFSPDLSSAMLEPRSDTPLSPESSELTPYLRENTEPPGYTPLVTAANVPPGTEFGSAVGLAGATPDLSHVVLRSEAPLVEGGPPAPVKSLYLWTAGQLQPVSVLPAAEGGAMVNTRLIGSGPGSVRHAISDDGSRVFWSAGELNLAASTITALYLRDTVAEETVRLDVPSGASGAGEPQPIFQGANADGTVVFFTDSQQLTEDASPSGRDLYRCEIPAGSSAAGCSTLIDITAPIAGSGESAEVQRLVPGMSDDGSTIYFVARAVLDSVANEIGETATSGEPNLYLWREGQGVGFIATLSEEDKHDWGGVRGLTSNLSAAASPSGRYLSFMSQRSLTGRDNLDVVSGEPVEEVFRYDASAERLDCASCNPTGAAPHSELSESFSLIDPQRVWEGRRIAAILPEPTVVQQEDVSLYSPRAVLDNGRVFFNSFNSLVPTDSNGEWDVYQYESTGAGDCTESSGDTATSRTEGGCVSLMSSGTGEEKAAFLDAGETGNDVFFLTPAKLNVTDEDSEFDVYDARVNGRPAERQPMTECAGEACQPTVSPPNDPTPASEAFHGPGNKRACPKGKRAVKRNGKARCAPRKHRKHHTRRSGRAGHNGMVSR